MDALTEQFLLEAREIIAQAIEDLVALERDPVDPSRIERLFRAFHTLKGSAGLVDLPPMVRLMHAAEEVLDGWRSGSVRPSTDLIDWALGSLDQVDAWLDEYERSGDLPPDAEAQAGSLIARQNPGLVKVATLAADVPDWAERMLRALPQGTTGPLVAVDYEPHRRCFFDGEDPLDRFRQLPGLLALRAAPREPWPPLGDMDPFDSNLRFRAIAQGPIAEVRARFASVADQVRIAEIDPAPGSRGPDRGLLAAILAEQVRLLDQDDEGDAAAGRIDSAVRTAAAALLHAGDPGGARQVEEAGRAALATGDATPLIAALQGRREENEAVEVPGTSGVALRVDPARMDALSELVGEIVVARNALGFLAKQAAGGMPAAELVRALGERDAEIGRLTTVLQQQVMALRLLPLAPVFRRFPRLVRDTARGLGKSVALVMRGEETQVDKAVVDMLFEPLLHLVRNALDHGIEEPADRRAAGKPDEAVISLAAFHRGERVVIEVSDDGKGMDDGAIRRTAVARGLLSEDEAAGLSGHEALRLVLRPGFSTASRVSDLSGRGVGMDVVRAAAEAVGGSVDLSSRPGKGTTCRLDLPISMALTRVLVVRVGSDRYGLPLSAAAEVLRLPRHEIRAVHGGQGFVLRGRTVPLVALGDLLGIPGPEHGDEVLTVVVSSSQGTVGLAVDGFEEQLDVALRPPDGLLAAMPNLLGTSLRGDGGVLLVLEPEALLG